jgi:hypothetical protein
MKKRNRISSLLTCRLHLISRRWLEYYSPNINSCILSHFLDEMLCVHSFFFMTLFQLVRWVLLQTKLSVTARNENKYLSRSKKKCGIPVEKTSVCAILTTHEAPIKKNHIILLSRWIPFLCYPNTTFWLHCLEWSLLYLVTI